MKPKSLHWSQCSTKEEETPLTRGETPFTFTKHSGDPCLSDVIVNM